MEMHLSVLPNAPLDLGPLHVTPWVFPQKNATVCLMSLEGPPKGPLNPQISPMLPATMPEILLLNSWIFPPINLEETLEIMCVSQGLTRQVEATFRLDKRTCPTAQRSAPVGATGIPRIEDRVGVLVEPGPWWAGVGDRMGAEPSRGPASGDAEREGAYPSPTTPSLPSSPAPEPSQPESS